MDFRFEDIVRTQILLTFQGQNKTIIGYILSSLLLLIVAYYTHIKQFFQDHINLFDTNKASIQLVGSIYEDRYYTRRIFSKRFISLLHFLNVKQSNNKYPVRKLLEVCIEDMEKVDKKSIDDMLINQKEPIQLTESIFCKFNVSCEDTTNDKKQFKYTTVNIHIYSKINSIKELQCFVDDCVTRHDEHLKSLLQKDIYNFIYDQNEEGFPCFKKIIFKSNKTFKNVFFTQKEELIKRLDFFTNGEQTYHKLGIPHTFGILMHGEPGTGKTSTIKAIVNHTKRHIISIPLHKVNDISVLTKLFLNEVIDGVTVPFDKRIYVFEELDCNGLGDILQQRETTVSTTTRKHSNEHIEFIDRLKGQILDKNIDISMEDVNSLVSVAYAPLNSNNEKNKKSITLGSLLELLDGVVETPGRIIIMTTNYPDKLDKALIRPGRIDMNIQFHKTSKQDICDMFNLWFSRTLTDNELESITPDRFSHADVCKIFFNNLNNSDIVINHLCMNDHK